MDPNVFTGCVYNDPRERPEDVEWVLDPVTNERSHPWDLTKAQIRGMDLSNLPVMIEHMDSPEHKDVYGNEVGRTISSSIDPVTGKTDITYRLHDTHAGFAAKTLTKLGSIKELSLHHTYYPSTGQVTAIEVSLCAKGARSGTQIYKGGTNSSKNSSVKKTSFVDICASDKMDTSQVQQPTLMAEGSEPPYAQEAAQQAPQQAAPQTTLEFWEDIASKVEDKEKQKEMYDRIGGYMKGAHEQKIEMAKSASTIASLEEKNKASAVRKE